MALVRPLHFYTTQLHLEALKERCMKRQPVWPQSFPSTLFIPSAALNPRDSCGPVVRASSITSIAKSSLWYQSCRGLLPCFTIWNYGAEAWEVSMVAAITTSCFSLSGSHLICFVFKIFAGRSYGSVNIIVFLLTHLLDTEYFYWALLRIIIKHFNTFICFSQPWSLPWQLCLALFPSLYPQIKEKKKKRYNSGDKCWENQQMCLRSSTFSLTQGLIQIPKWTLCNWFHWFERV